MTIDAPFRDGLTPREKQVKGGRVILFGGAACVSTVITTTTSATVPGSECKCTHTNNGATNACGLGCDDLYDHYYMDDDDFTLHDMCCHTGYWDGSDFEPGQSYRRGGLWLDNGAPCGTSTTTTSTTTTVCTKPNGDPCETCDFQENMV